MKARWLFYLALITFSIFCLMGLTNSQQTRLSVMVSDNPFYLMARDLPSWDWGTNDVSNLGKVPILEWATVLKTVDNSSGKDKEYFITQEEFETIVRNNVFLFSRLGLCTNTYLSIWDLNTSMGYKRWLEIPHSYIVAKLLTDSKQDAIREEFMNAAMRILKEPKTKTLWAQQRDSFCQTMIDEWQITPEDEAWIDYQRMLNTDYDSSMQLAFNNLIRVMNGTDFSLKVIPSYGALHLVRVINQFFEYVRDDSPMQIHSACYRMGPDATRKMIGYIERARDGLLK